MDQIDALCTVDVSDDDRSTISSRSSRSGRSYSTDRSYYADSDDDSASDVAPIPKRAKNGQTVDTDFDPKVKKRRKLSKKFKLSELPLSWLPRQAGTAHTAIETIRNAVLDRDFAVAFEMFKGMTHHPLGARVAGWFF